MATTRTNKVEVEIVATDEASPKIDKLEKKIDGLESDEARIIITSNINRLEEQLDAAQKKLDGLDGDEATVQARLVGNLESDLDAANKLFDQLDGKTGTVTFTADTSDLDSAASRATSDIDGVSRSADGANNALANMVGNSAQDLGALGGIAGSAGVALGQMAEYASDAALGGEALSKSIGSMLKVVGPIAGLVLAMEGIKFAMEGTAESTELSADQQERWVKALEDGEGAAQRWIEQMRESRQLVVNMRDLDGELEDLTRTMDGFSWGEFFNPFQQRTKEVEDITELFERAGITIDQFSTAISGTADDQERFRDAVEQSKLSGDDQLLVMSLLTQETKAYQEALEAQKQFSAVFDPVTEGTRQSAEQMAALNAQQDAYVAGLERRATEAARVQEVVDAEQRHYDALYAVNQEHERVDRANAIEDEKWKVADLAAEYEELHEAVSGELSFQRLLEGLGRANEQFEEGNLTLREARILMLEQQDAVLRYIDTVGDVPTETTTRILSLIDAGQFDRAMQLLGQLSVPITVPVKLTVDDEIPASIRALLAGTAPLPQAGIGGTGGVTNIFNPPGSPAQTVSSGNVYYTRNGVRVGP